MEVVPELALRVEGGKVPATMQALTRGILFLGRSLANIYLYTCSGGVEGRPEHPPSSCSLFPSPEGKPTMRFRILEGLTPRRSSERYYKRSRGPGIITGDPS